LTDGAVKPSVQNISDREYCNNNKKNVGKNEAKFLIWKKREVDENI